MSSRSTQTSANWQNFVEERPSFRFEEIAGALMGQDHSHATRHFFADPTEDEADDLDRLTGIIHVLGTVGRSTKICSDRGYAGPVTPTFPKVRWGGGRSTYEPNLKGAVQAETIPYLSIHPSNRSD